MTGGGGVERRDEAEARRSALRLWVWGFGVRVQGLQGLGFRV